MYHEPIEKKERQYSTLDKDAKMFQYAMPVRNESQVCFSFTITIF